MASGTPWPNLALHNWNGTDYVKRVEFNENFQKIDAEFHGTTGHGHTGAAGDGPKISASGLAAGAATDAVIGNRTINDAIAIGTTDTDSPTNLWSKIGAMIRAITGKADWYTAPAINLETVNTHTTTTTSGIHGSSSTATPSTLVHRDASGRAQFADPSAAQDAATKAYVDAAKAAAQKYLP